MWHNCDKVIITWTYDQRNASYELRVTIYCKSCDCNADSVKFLYYIEYSNMIKTKYSQPAIPELYIL